MVEDPWDLLRDGKQGTAFDRLLAIYAHKASTSNAMTLGVAYLWERQYEDAARHFEKAMQAYPLHSSVIYASAGVARWCLNEPTLAIRHWRAGMECRYADAAGGVKLPMLLFFASAMDSSLISTSEAEGLLRSRIGNARIQSWPAPLGRYALKMIDEETVLRSAVHDNTHEMASRQSTVRFYKGVGSYSCGDYVTYRNAMQHVASVTWDHYDRDPRLFFALIWQDVFFLARHQLLIAGP